MWKCFDMKTIQIYVSYVGFISDQRLINRKVCTTFILDWRRNGTVRKIHLRTFSSLRMIYLNSTVYCTFQIHRFVIKNFNLNI
jgi:hypothetical protein